ncbi:hypothetical protein BDBG_17800, partial [Blastomyces gilchristii SLH14081]
MLAAPLLPSGCREPAKKSTAAQHHPNKYHEIGLRVLPGISLVVRGRAGTWGRLSSRKGIPGQVSKLLSHCGSTPSLACVLFNSQPIRCCQLISFIFFSLCLLPLLLKQFPGYISTAAARSPILFLLRVTAIYLRCVDPYLSLFSQTTLPQLPT